MKVNRVRLADQVCNKIQEMIAQGIYHPGEKLPVENEFAEMFQVSRVTIREAFVKLGMMGIVDVRQGEGTFVRSLAPESFMKPLLPALVLSQANLTDIYVARITIEKKTVELAARDATREEMARMSEILAEMESAIAGDDQNAYDEADFQFHLEIARASHNVILFTILELLQDYMRYSIVAVSGAPTARKNSTHSHPMIFDAIQRRRPDLAVKYMEEHLSGGFVYAEENEGR